MVMAAIHGPMAASRLCGLHPNCVRMALIIDLPIPASVPLQPACPNPIACTYGSYISNGAQSANFMNSDIPLVFVINASAFVELPTR